MKIQTKNASISLDESIKLFHSLTKQKLSEEEIKFKLEEVGCEVEIESEEDLILLNQRLTNTNVPTI